MQYLLSGNTLMQLCLERTTLASAWADDRPAAELRLSLIGVSMARAWVDALEPGRRRAWHQALEQRITETMNESGRPLPLDDRVMREWMAIRTETLHHYVENENGRREIFDIGQDQRMEIATAIAYKVKLVDPWAPFHDQLRNMGMGNFIESLHE